MRNLIERINNLSPQKKEILKQKLVEQGYTLANIPITRQPPSDSAVLSFAQQRLYVLDLLLTNKAAYNVPLVIKLDGVLDQAALQAALDALSERHGALRTSFFVGSDDRAYQTVSAETRVAISHVDFSDLDSAEGQAQARRHIQHEVAEPFHLTDLNQRLIRVSLLTLSEQEHVLLVVMHHAIVDGWSIGIFFRELAMLYQAFAQNQPNPLTDTPLQYTDFAIWQREWLQGPFLEKSLSYWRDQLQGLPTSLPLPTDHPRPSVQSYAGATHLVALPADALQKLQAFAQGENATLFMVLLAAFQLLLARYTDQHDIVVGTPVANRHQPELEKVIGFFINMLALRTDTSGNPSFRELVQRVRTMTLEAYAHQEVPFEKLVEALQIKRDASYSPIFQTMFILQNAPNQQVSLPELSLSTLEAANKTAKYDLTLTLNDSAEGLQARWEYATALFDAATIERMAGHFNFLLTQIAADPSRPIGEYDLVTPAEEAQFAEWNATDYPTPPRCLHELIAEQAARTPDRIAVADPQRQLTYRELDERANQLAHHLQTLGVAPDTFVAIALDRSAEMIVALLGILKAGGAYLPLDPGFPAARIQFMMADADAPVMLTQASLCDGLPESDAAVVCIDSDWPTIATYPTTPPPSAVTPHHLFYVIYTSGSTGKPKGVQIQHHSVVNLLVSMAREPGISAEDKMIAITTLSFDLTTVEAYLPLLVGAQVFVAPKEAVADVYQLMALLKQEQITILQATPTTWQMLITAEWKGQPGLKMITGGERLPVAMAKQMLARGGTLWNMYGPSETTTYSTVQPVFPEDIDPNRTLSVGHAMDNTQLYVLDDNLKRVPVGVGGTLYIGGDGVSRGYLNRPELTAERFIDDPFSDKPGAKLYNSGDLVEMRSDGSLGFLGRADHQVKIRGFRIELGEIESCLQQHPAVAQAVVHPQQQQLVAYVIFEHGMALTSAELRAYVQETLPAYMVPHVITIMPTFPRTPNGKVDRKQLPVPDSERDTGNQFVAPRNDIEIRLVDIWRTVLKVDKIGIRDNFFELGGDSLMVIQSVSQAKRFGMQFSYQQMFQHQTIADLAPTVELFAQSNGMVATDTAEWPLTADQQWFFSRNLIEPHRFTIATLLKVSIPLNADLLRESVAMLMQTHPILRARFVQDEAGWHQIVDATMSQIPFFVQDIDVTGLSPLEQKRALEAVFEPAREAINLSTGPAIHVHYIRINGSETDRLFINVHHLICDGVSTNILFQDLLSIYMQKVQGEQPMLPASTMDARDWVTQLQTYADSPASQAELDYWLNLPWEAARPLPVDFDLGRDRNTVGSSAMGVQERIASSLTEDETVFLLRDMQKSHGLSVETVMLAAMTKAVTDWTGSDWFSTKMIDSGRNAVPDLEEADLSRTVGWLSFTRHLMLEWDHGRDALANAYAIDHQLKRMPNRGLGHDLLLRYSQNEATVNTLQANVPEWEDIWINYVGQAAEITNPILQRSDEGVGWHMHPDNQRAYLLFCFARIQFNQFTMQWEYSANVHHSDTIVALASNFLSTMQAIIQACRERALSENELVM